MPLMFWEASKGSREGQKRTQRSCTAQPLNLKSDQNGSAIRDPVPRPTPNTHTGALPSKLTVHWEFNGDRKCVNFKSLMLYGLS